MKWFVKCIKNYVTFAGRARRKEYWNFVLFSVIFMLIAGVLDALLGSGTPGTGGWVTNCLTIFLILPALAVQVRRLHDTGKSGYRILWYVLFYGLWMMAILILGGCAIFSMSSCGMDMLGQSIGMLVLLGLGGLVMLVWGILFLVWYCTNGDQGDNKYGADPKSIEE